MNVILVILALLAFVVIPLQFYDVAEKSMRKSVKGQLKYFMGNIFYSFGKLNMKFGRKLAETKKERDIRMANEIIKQYNYMLFFSYFFDSYHNKDKTIRYLRKSIDLHQVKSALDVLGLSYECWEQTATKLYYWGIIVTMSRDKRGRNRYYQDIKYIRNDKQNRSNIINSVYIYGYDTERICTVLIKEALEYFNISESDWIEYGDAVINMKNIDFDPNIQHIGNFNPLDIWLENDSIELVRYRDFKSNDYKKSDTV